MISYLISNLKTGKKYVGISSETLEKRWKRHVTCIENGKTLLYRSMKKHGIESFKIELLETYLTWEEATNAEKLLIEKFQTFAFEYPENGYNMTQGGDGAPGYKFTVEQREMMSQRAMGENNPFFGHKHSPEVIERMKQSHRNTILSEENMFKLIERCKKMGLNARGKKHSEKSRKNMGDGHKISVDQLSIDGTFMQSHLSALDAELATGVKHQHIYRCCRGIRKSSGGFKWRYTDETRVPH